MSKLDALITLQKALNHVDCLKEEIDDIPNRIEALQNDKQKVSEVLKQEQAMLKQHRTSLSRAELDLGTAEEDLKRKQIQLFSIKNNKEYTAMEHETDALRKKISDLEDEVLILMDKIDEESERIGTRENQAAAEIRDFDEQITSMQGQLQTRKTELETAVLQEQEARKEVHPSLVASFDKLYQKNAGVAVVAVNENVCGHCHVRIPPQTLTEIRDGWAIIHCESCSCVLYSEQSSDGVL